MVALIKAVGHTLMKSLHRLNLETEKGRGSGKRAFISHNVSFVPKGVTTLHIVTKYCEIRYDILSKTKQMEEQKNDAMLR
jgi:hypothetical protein